MQDFKSQYPDRECREVWVDNEGQAVKVQGFSCLPSTPDYLWCPEVGSSLSLDHHIFPSEKEAVEAIIKKLSEEMEGLALKRHKALQEFARLSVLDDKMHGSVREALELLDQNAPGRAREVLIEALSK